MAMDDLFRALGMFQDGVQQYAITKGIQSAAGQVDQINQSTMDLMQKRQAQSQLANQLSMQLAQAGASGQQIQTAVGAVAPPAIKNSQDAYMQGLQTGDPQMMKLAKDAQKVETDAAVAPNMILQNSKQGFDASQSALDRQNKLDIARIEANKQSKQTKLLPSGLADRFANLDDSIVETRSIMSRLENEPELKGQVGPVAGIDIIKSWTNPQFADFKSQIGQLFDKYRKAITGAGAGPKELEMLQKNVPSIKDTPDVLIAKLKRMEDMGVQLKNKRLENYQKMGYDTGTLASDQSSLMIEADQKKKKDAPPQQQGGRPSYVPADYQLKVASDGKKYWVEPNPANPQAPLAYPAE